MNEKFRELVALGASVSAHCYPCLEFHLKEAERLGATGDEIQEAIRVGLAVMNGAGVKMAEKVRISIPKIRIKGDENCCTKK